MVVVHFRDLVQIAPDDSNLKYYRLFILYSFYQRTIITNEY